MRLSTFNFKAEYFATGGAYGGFLQYYCISAFFGGFLQFYCISVFFCCGCLPYFRTSALFGDGFANIIVHVRFVGRVSPISFYKCIYCEVFYNFLLYDFFFVMVSTLPPLSPLPPSHLSPFTTTLSPLNSHQSPPLSFTFPTTTTSSSPPLPPTPL